MTQFPDPLAAIGGQNMQDAVNETIDRVLIEAAINPTASVPPPMQTDKVIEFDHSNVPTTQNPFARKCFMFSVCVSPDGASIAIPQVEQTLKRSDILLLIQYNTRRAGYIERDIKEPIMLKVTFDSSQMPSGLYNLFRNTISTPLPKLDEKCVLSYFGPKLGAYLLQQTDTVAMFNILRDNPEGCLTIFGFNPTLYNPKICWYRKPEPKKKPATEKLKFFDPEVVVEWDEFSKSSSPVANAMGISLESLERARQAMMNNAANTAF